LSNFLLKLAFGSRILNPDPHLNYNQVISDPDPGQTKVSDPGGSGSATLIKA